MARIMVDEEGRDDSVMQWGFTNEYGNVEFVSLNWETISVCDDEGGKVSDFFIQDIPKLIKALQAAYNFKQQGEKI
jgi:hypothetical protein